MARGVKDPNLHIAEFQYVAFTHCSKVVLSSCLRIKRIPGSGNFRQFPGAGNMVGMNVGIQNVDDLEPELLGGLQIRSVIVDGVAHGARSSSTSTEKIRSRDHRLGLQELTQNHSASSREKSEVRRVKGDPLVATLLSCLPTTLRPAARRS